MTRSITQPPATIARALLVLLGIVHGSSAIAESSGSIAYVRPGKSRGDEIRGIDADGGRDRSIWRIPGPAYAGVTGLAWKPDGNRAGVRERSRCRASVFESGRLCHPARWKRPAEDSQTGRCHRGFHGTHPDA